MNRRTLIPFFSICFGLTWGIASLLILFPEQVTALFGELNARNPLFMLAVYSPAVAALALVIYHGGLTGLRRYLSRLLLWRVHWGWYAFILIVVPLLFYLAAAIKGNLWSEPFPLASWEAAIPALFFMLFLGPVEEFGWRGLALPLLQRRYIPFWAGMILGLIWGVWHLPAFFLSGIPQGAWSFLPFLVGSIAIGMITTPLFNSSGGSILLPMLLHWQIINPIFPDAAPHDATVFVIAAIVVVFIHRSRFFTMDGSATEVIPEVVYGLRSRRAVH
ncbi:MAG: CPBP family intramembrane metalloprotease [Chromatiales bacterium]|nr:CPBP family intramembrane metalloprotease [Chromatiales bacterium]